MVVAIVHEVNRAAAELRPVFEHCFVNPRAIKPLSAEGGDQRRVNVDDAVLEIRRNHDQLEKSAHHDDIGRRLAASGEDRVAECLVRLERAAARSHPRESSARERIATRRAAALLDMTSSILRIELPRRDLLNQIPQRRPAAGNQHNQTKRTTRRELHRPTLAERDNKWLNGALSFSPGLVAPAAYPGFRDERAHRQPQRGCGIVGRDADATPLGLNDVFCECVPRVAACGNPGLEAAAPLGRYWLSSSHVGHLYVNRGANIADRNVHRFNAGQRLQSTNRPSTFPANIISELLDGRLQFGRIGDDARLDAIGVFAVRCRGAGLN